MTKLNKHRAHRHLDQVEVYLWGRMMGAVCLDSAHGYYAFTYAPEFVELGVQPSPLHMPVNSGDAYLFTDLPAETYMLLPAMLSDALPDDFGNALINHYMARQGIDAAEVTPLDRLAFMSTRAIGALTFRSSRGPATREPKRIELSSLVQEARRAVSGTLGDDEHANAAIMEVGTSAGGARAKAVIAWNPHTHEMRAGHLEAPAGFEHWLLKFDGMGRDSELGESGGYGRIEYAYCLMAREAGIDMMPCRLLEENGRAHFMTRRFDREAGDVRHHVQTLCAMAHVDFKQRGANSYDRLFMTIERLGLPLEQREEAFRRMVLNILARNCDDHSKNFSFRLRQGAQWELAPAYDVTFAHNPLGEWTHQHLMSANGKFKDFTEADLLAVAARFAIGSAPRVIRQVRSAVAAWPDFAQQAQVPSSQREHIGALHLKL